MLRTSGCPLSDPTRTAGWNRNVFDPSDRGPFKNGGGTAQTAHNGKPRNRQNGGRRGMNAERREIHGLASVSTRVPGSIKSAASPPRDRNACIIPRGGPPGHLALPRPDPILFPGGDLVPGGHQWSAWGLEDVRMFFFWRCARPPEAFVPQVEDRRFSPNRARRLTSSG